MGGVNLTTYSRGVGGDDPTPIVDHHKGQNVWVTDYIAMHPIIGFSLVIFGYRGHRRISSGRNISIFRREGDLISMRHKYFSILLLIKLLPF